MPAQALRLLEVVAKSIELTARRVGLLRHLKKDENGSGSVRERTSAVPQQTPGLSKLFERERSPGDRCCAGRRRRSREARQRGARAFERSQSRSGSEAPSARRRCADWRRSLTG